MATQECSNRLCKNFPDYRIIYDIGIGTQELTLCAFHYGLDSVFQKNIKKISEIRK